LLGGEADPAGKATPKGAAPVVGKPPRRSH
jgi:hypothetical protein